MIDYTPHPVIFRLGPVTVHSVGLAFFLAFLFGFFLGVKEVRRRGLDVDEFKKLFLLIVVGVVIGARLFFVLENAGFFLNSPLEVFRLWKGGASSYGGFIGGFVLPYLYFRKRGLNFWAYVDAVVPAICMGIFFKRIGCFLNWCCYGIESQLPWAVDAGDFPRHPTQIYLALNGLMLFFVFSYLKKQKRYQGWLFLAGVIGFSFTRFFIEFLRDSPRYLLHLTVAQWSAVVLVVLSFLIHWRKRKIQK